MREWPTIKTTRTKSDTRSVTKLLQKEKRTNEGIQ